MKGQDSRKSDEYRTPKDLFERLDKEFHFVLDAAATNENKLCSAFYDKESCTLERNWAITAKRGVIWCHPPYSKCREFVKKAHYEWYNGCKIVMLLPARTDSKYFHEYLWPTKVAGVLTEPDWYGGHRSGFYVEFIKGKLKFEGDKSSASMLVYLL